MIFPRKFQVWCNCNHAGSEPEETTIEMPADATDAECDEMCRDALNQLIANEFDTGWDEII